MGQGRTGRASVWTGVPLGEKGLRGETLKGRWRSGSALSQHAKLQTALNSSS